MRKLSTWLEPGRSTTNGKRGNCTSSPGSARVLRHPFCEVGSGFPEALTRPVSVLSVLTRAASLTPSGVTQEPYNAAGEFAFTVRAICKAAVA